MSQRVAVTAHVDAYIEALQAETAADKAVYAAEAAYSLACKHNIDMTSARKRAFDELDKALREHAGAK